MSPARKARLTRTNSSTHSRGRRYHLLRLAMIPPKLLRHRLEIDHVRQHRVVAVPLDEVGAAHEGAVLGGPAVVVPQVEVLEVDRVLERLVGQQALLAQL